MTKVKMCGLFRNIDIEYANKLMPDYIGFVFYKKSHRYVNAEMASILKSELNHDIKTVGVFVNDDIYFISELVRKKIIDVVQLHGTENESYIKKLRESCSNPTLEIIKALQIKDCNTSDLISRLYNQQHDFNYINFDYSCYPNYYLFDSGMGSGSTFDWKILNTINKYHFPIFLAGGINPGNVETAIKEVKPFAIDVSSGIETDKFKDFSKMKDLIDKVNSFNKRGENYE